MLFISLEQKKFWIGKGKFQSVSWARELQKNKEMMNDDGRVKGAKEKKRKDRGKKPQRQFTHLWHEYKEKRDANEWVEDAKKSTTGCCWCNVPVTHLAKRYKIQIYKNAKFKNAKYQKRYKNTKYITIDQSSGFSGSNMTVTHRWHYGDGEQNCWFKGEVPWKVPCAVVTSLGKKTQICYLKMRKKKMIACLRVSIQDVSFQSCQVVQNSLRKMVVMMLIIKKTLMMAGRMKKICLKTRLC